MKVLNIGMDMDGCVANFAYGYSQWLRNLYGNHLPIVESDKQISDWDWDKWYPLTKEQLDTAWNKLLEDGGRFWMNLPLVDVKGWESFCDLRKYSKCVVYFITLRPNFTAWDAMPTQRQTKIFLEKHGWYEPTVLIAKNDKSSIQRDLDLHYSIDDNAKYAIDTLAKNPKCKVFLYDTNYNQVCPKGYSEELFNQLIRVKSLTEYVDFIKKDNSEISW